MSMFKLASKNSLCFNLKLAACRFLSTSIVGELQDTLLRLRADEDNRRKIRISELRRLEDQKITSFVAELQRFHGRLDSCIGALRAENIRNGLQITKVQLEKITEKYSS